MKKLIITLLLLVAMLLSAACTGSDNKAPTNKLADIEELLAGDISGEITVSCYETYLYQSFLEEAAELFEAAYPGTKVNVECFAKLPEVKTIEIDENSSMAVSDAGDETQAKQDYVNRINTELMGGKGPDILAIDVLPYHKYAESGMLEDLQTYMTADAIENYKRYYFRYQHGAIESKFLTP